jgi:hypothetical protein
MSASKISSLETIVAALTATVATLTARVDALEKSSVATPSITVTPSKRKGAAPREKTPRGPSGWSLFFKHVTAEMKNANPETKFKLTDFVTEAKKRKENGGYDEAHWKEQASKMAVSA